MRFMFGDHLLDASRRELRRAGALVAVEPQVFDLLLYLLKNRDRVVSKDDLIENVWKGRVVSDATVDSRIKAARHAVADSGAGQEVLRTFARRGVRFVADVREGSGSVETEPALPPALPDKPSIAVLPFQNMSSDPDQEYFVDGMVEEIITALARIRWLFVVARNSSFTYKGQAAVDVKQVGQELGAHYVLASCATPSTASFSCPACGWPLSDGGTRDIHIMAAIKCTVVVIRKGRDQMGSSVSA